MGYIHGSFVPELFFIYKYILLLCIMHAATSTATPSKNNTFRYFEINHPSSYFNKLHYSSCKELHALVKTLVLLDWWQNKVLSDTFNLFFNFLLKCRTGPVRGLVTLTHKLIFVLELSKKVKKKEKWKWQNTPLWV